MCGINGIITSEICDINKITNDIKQMNDSIIHRGPDEYGEFVINMKDYCCAMAMRRLSIIDLNLGSQPIYSEDGDLVIIFNGEIFNFQELKEQVIYYQMME